MALVVALNQGDHIERRSLQVSPAQISAEQITLEEIAPRQIQVVIDGNRGSNYNSADLGQAVSSPSFVASLGAQLGVPIFLGATPSVTLFVIRGPALPPSPPPFPPALDIGNAHTADLTPYRLEVGGLAMAGVALVGIVYALAKWRAKVLEERLFALAARLKAEAEAKAATIIQSRFRGVRARERAAVLAVAAAEARAAAAAAAAKAAAEKLARELEEAKARAIQLEKEAKQAARLARLQALETPKDRPPEWIATASRRASSRGQGGEGPNAGGPAAPWASESEIEARKARREARFKALDAPKELEAPEWVGRAAKLSSSRAQQGPVAGGPTVPYASQEELDARRARREARLQALASTAEQPPAWVSAAGRRAERRAASQAEDEASGDKTPDPGASCRAAADDKVPVSGTHQLQQEEEQVKRYEFLEKAKAVANAAHKRAEEARRAVAEADTASAAALKKASKPKRPKPKKPKGEDARKSQLAWLLDAEQESESDDEDEVIERQALEAAADATLSVAEIVREAARAAEAEAEAALANVEAIAAAAAHAQQKIDAELEREALLQKKREAREAERKRALEQHTSSGAVTKLKRDSQRDSQSESTGMDSDSRRASLARMSTLPVIPGIAPSPDSPRAVANVEGIVSSRMDRIRSDNSRDRESTIRAQQLWILNTLSAQNGSESDSDGDGAEQKKGKSTVARKLFDGSAAPASADVKSGKDAADMANGAGTGTSLIRSIQLRLRAFAAWVKRLLGCGSSADPYPATTADTLETGRSQPQALGTAISPASPMPSAASGRREASVEKAATILPQQIWLLKALRAEAEMFEDDDEDEQLAM